MASPITVDFDAWRAEKAAKKGTEGDPPQFKIGGKSYPLPVEPPATIVLDLARLKVGEGEDATVPLGALRQIGVSLFGEDTFREILTENVVGAYELGDLIEQVFRAWPDYVVDTEDAVPNRKTRRARQPST